MREKFGRTSKVLSSLQTSLLLLQYNSSTCTLLLVSTLCFSTQILLFEIYSSQYGCCYQSKSKLLRRKNNDQNTFSFSGSTTFSFLTWLKLILEYLQTHRLDIVNSIIGLSPSPVNVIEAYPLLFQKDLRRYSYRNSGEFRSSTTLEIHPTFFQKSNTSDSRRIVVED